MYLSKVRHDNRLQDEFRNWKLNGLKQVGTFCGYIVEDIGGVSNLQERLIKLCVANFKQALLLIFVGSLRSLAHWHVRQGITCRRASFYDYLRLYPTISSWLRPAKMQGTYGILYKAQS